jgi:hypothetical protein
MTDAAMAIGGAVQSLKAIAEIGKALLNIRDAALIREKVIELNGEIISAQSGALTAQSAQSALLEQIRQLETHVAELEAWNAEAETYKLADVAKYGLTGKFAYAPKEGTHASEPPHLICAQCYQGKHKSILQAQVLYPGHCETLICLNCESIIYLSGDPQPQHFALRPRRSNR